MTRENAPCRSLSHDPNEIWRGRARRHRKGQMGPGGEDADSGCGKGRRHGHERGRGGRKRLFDYGELRLLILSMIQKKPSHGYEIIKGISDRFNGQYTPSPGVIYPTLSWLEDMGYIRISAIEGGRKQSAITADGQAFLAANMQLVEDLLSRRPPYGDTPQPVIEAMDRLKTALRNQLHGADTDPATLAEIVAAIDAAAQRVNGDTK